MKLSRLVLPLTLGMTLMAHPMGNFSLSHYTKIAVGPRGADVLYVLDLAEIPTFEILRQWKLERSSPPAELERKAAEQAREWIRHLKITANGRAVAPQFQGVELKISDGAGGLAGGGDARRVRRPGVGRPPVADPSKPGPQLWHGADRNRRRLWTGGGACAVARSRKDDRRGVSGRLARHGQARRVPGRDGDVHPHRQCVLARVR